jgi:hypothetical protein
MDFMIEIGWIGAVRLIIQANYDRSRTSFYSSPVINCHSGVLLPDDVMAPLWRLLANRSLPSNPQNEGVTYLLMCPRRPAELVTMRKINVLTKLGNEIRGS